MVTLTSIKRLSKSIAIALLLSLSLTSCGEGVSFDDDDECNDYFNIDLLNVCPDPYPTDSVTLIEGTLTEADDQKIEDATICALDKCSTTDRKGKWGFETPESFKGGDVLFSIKGSGIDTTTVINIPNSKEVYLELSHEAGGQVVASHLSADGSKFY